MRSGPLVSIILPVFNAGAYLRPAVNSVSRQTYDNIEILAIDDGSTDGSGAVLTDLASRDSRIRVTSQENRGLIRTLNDALARAQGSLIARMDADDICLPTRIAEQVESFEQNPDLALCGTTHHLLFRPGWLLNPAFQDLDTTDEQTAVGTDAELAAAGRAMTELSAARSAFERALWPGWDASFGYIATHVIETADITSGPRGVRLLLEAFPEGWSLVRRRDRAIIRAGAWLPARSWRGLKAVESRMGTRSAGRIEEFIPNYADIR
jgi:glycosyltransferase involved in cell wall biosynthesis